MRIQRNYFNTREEAEKAQAECVCAACGSRLKWQVWSGIPYLTCLKNPNHKHLRPA